MLVSEGFHSSSSQRL